MVEGLEHGCGDKSVADGLEHRCSAKTYTSKHPFLGTALFDSLGVSDAAGPETGTNSSLSTIPVRGIAIPMLFFIITMIVSPLFII